MNSVILYSTHGYTQAIANRIDALNIPFREASTLEEMLSLLNTHAVDLIILDSSNEKNISDLIDQIDQSEINRSVSILFLIPGKVCYQEKQMYSNKRAILGLSKPFLPAQISSLVNLLIQKKQNRDKLQKSYDEMQQFSVMASHDLKTPMKNIYAYTDIMLNGLKASNLPADNPAYSSLKVIQNESKRMIQLVNDMFEFSIAGKVDFENKVFDLPSFIEQVFTMVKTEHPSKNTELILQDIPQNFMGDPARLTHVFQNLFENSIKYASNDIPVKIKVECFIDTQHMAHFSIEDNGPGIAEEDCEKIFLPFKRGRTKVKGTGIGLAVVRKVIEALNGKIWIEHKYNDGAKFIFTIPLTQEDTHYAAAT